MARILHQSSSQEGVSHLSLPLLTAFLALISITATISALCASHRRKSKTRSPPPSRSMPEECDMKEDASAVVLPATHGPIGPADPPGGPMTPRRKLSVSLSLKIPEGLSKVRTGRREANGKEKVAGSTSASAEESVWMKTIILGEKCKVPENGEAEEEEAGSRQKNYHPRTPRSMPVSRTNSFFTLPAS